MVDRTSAGEDPVSAQRRASTSTSAFGAGRRENHDASAFYARFTPPVISDDEEIRDPVHRDEIWLGEAQKLLADESCVADKSVALVVTSPPYFVGKSYEEAMGEGHVPEDYEAHLETLHEVFARCVDKLEPGGRIAVNVANLGRRPYRSQAADVLRIFEDLGLLVRGEIIWQKSLGLTGSTAWGSFQSAANPVLRDTTERIIVASKGRFDRALSRKIRAQQGKPSASTMTREAFMSYTTDVWTMPAESATRVGHPAPFPVALPRRLIELYTYEADLVLDPYMGSGSTAVAAMRTNRSYAGCETEQAYLDAAGARIAAERDRLLTTEERRQRLRVVVPAVANSDDDGDADPLARAVREGRRAEELALLILDECGFTVTKKNAKLATGVEVDFVAESPDGSVWHFDVTGAFTSERGGLRRTDTLWKSLGKAAVRKRVPDDPSGNRFVLLTTDLPASGVGLKALRAARGDVILDAIEMLSEEGRQRLLHYAQQGDVDEPIGDLLGPEEPDALF
ncbi:MAG: site-specific DNA-methyltransferase [Acidimicrobiia bacterium]|nr:site-specific DNA-methyltransferase [Acidimicrobiia bacterium]